MQGSPCSVECITELPLGWPRESVKVLACPTAAAIRLGSKLLALSNDCDSYKQGLRIKTFNFLQSTYQAAMTTMLMVEATTPVVANAAGTARILPPISPEGQVVQMQIFKLLERQRHCAHAW